MRWTQPEGCPRNQRTRWVVPMMSMRYKEATRVLTSARNCCRCRKTDAMVRAAISQGFKGLSDVQGAMSKALKKWETWRSTTFLGGTMAKICSFGRGWPLLRSDIREDDIKLVFKIG